jgi:RNase P subunit RPR2
MSIKMGGYLCDKCRQFIIYPTDPHYLQARLLLENPNIMLRIYCKPCGDLKARVEHTMRLENELPERTDND